MLRQRLPASIEIGSVLHADLAEAELRNREQKWAEDGAGALRRVMGLPVERGSVFDVDGFWEGLALRQEGKSFEGSVALFDGIFTYERYDPALRARGKAPAS